MTIKNKYTTIPGFCDIHVHFREPGFLYKETIKTGSEAAACGGYTAVCTMPNLEPVCDSIEHLEEQLRIIDKDANIHIYPYVAITIGQKGKEIVNFESVANKCIAFSDDGHGVQDEKIMSKAMLKAKKLNKIIVAHCEDNKLLKGGYIYDGVYARKHGHKGICSESEWKQIERDIKLVKEIGCAYHVCHISTKESVDIIRKAKKNGINITCETAPHYLLLDDSMLEENGKWKMNPPIRDKTDKEALIEGINDGTIDCIATDHAPHSVEEKSKGLDKSSFGVVGLEIAFPLLYTYLVKEKIVSMEKLQDCLIYNPRKRFNIPLRNDYSMWNLDEEWTIDSQKFCSKGKATPFDGWKVYGKNYLTVCDGVEIYKCNME